MKIALFRNMRHQFESVSSEALDGSADYVRISQYIDVEFPPLPREDVLVAEVARIDENITAITQEFAQRLDALKGRKQELLAITDGRAA